MAEKRIVQEKLHDRSRIGEPRSLDQHTGEHGNFAAITLREQPPERVLQVTAHGAADTPARQHDGLAGDGLDQEMVERNLAEFVDDYRGVRHPRPLQ